MLVKIEARILIFPGTDFHFPSTSVPPGTFLGSAVGLSDTAIRPSVPSPSCLRRTAALVYRHAGCLQLSHVRAAGPSMAKLQPASMLLD